MESSKPIPHAHFLLHKPLGYLSQFRSNARHEQNKRFLGALYDFPEGVMPVGRLDKNSEGLLLLTTDGKLSHEICSSGIEKEYYVQVDGEMTQTAIDRLQEGVPISYKNELYHTLACKAFIINDVPDFPDRTKKIRDARHGPTTWVSITIKEGKFRQVRKMTAAVGFPTLRLVRIRVGRLCLNHMPPGEVIKVQELRVG